MIEKPHNQARNEPDDVHNQVHNKYGQVLGMELQSPTTKGLHNLVPGVESQTSTVQGSGSGESRDQPPCCLTHSYKSNIVFTERMFQQGPGQHREIVAEKLQQGPGQTRQGVQQDSQDT